MKKLKITLSDNKDYTFCTFSLLEQQALKKRFKDFMKTEEEQNKIRFKYNEEKKQFEKDSDGNLISNVVDEEGEKLIEEKEEKSISFMIDVLRKSLCKTHPDFKKKDKKEEDDLVVQQLKDMFDLDDLKNITFFIFNGIYTERETVIDVTTNEKPK
jgi:hypothetical protein